MDKIENQIISRYKKVIWKSRKIAKATQKKKNINDIIQILDDEIRFYIKFIYKEKKKNTTGEKPVPHPNTGEKPTHTDEKPP